MKQSRTTMPMTAREQGLTIVHFSAQPKPFRSVNRFVSSL